MVKASQENLCFEFEPQKRFIINSNKDIEIIKTKEMDYFINEQSLNLFHVLKSKLVF